LLAFIDGEFTAEAIVIDAAVPRSILISNGSADLATFSSPSSYVLNLMVKQLSRSSGRNDEEREGETAECRLHASPAKASLLN
jgi:hypothetical protein